MHTEELLAALLELAELVGLEVRKEYLGGEGGGLCVLRGKRILILDTGSDTAEQVARTASALARLSEVETMYVLPQVREVLAAYRERS